MKEQTQFCGMFLTPTLRNVATQKSISSHNGVFRTLQEVKDFYAFRDVQPGLIYPRKHDGTMEKIR